VYLPYSLKTLKQICEEFCDTFYLKNDVLTCTSTVSHEINTRTNSALVNVHPYHLPEKHKKEVSDKLKRCWTKELSNQVLVNAPVLVVPKKTF